MGLLKIGMGLQKTGMGLPKTGMGLPKLEVCFFTVPMTTNGSESGAWLMTRNPT